jgi:hypothetical protein
MNNNQTAQRQKRKNRCWVELLSCPKSYLCGGFDTIKAAVPYALNKGVMPMC